MSKAKRSANGSSEGNNKQEYVKPIDNSPYVFKDRSKIDFHLDIRENIPFTPKQKDLFKLIQDKNTKMVYISGPAGCSKTMSAIYCGLHELNNKKVSQILYIRAAVESADSKLGMLPGEILSKVEPYLIPLKEKLEEFLTVSQVKSLQAGNFIEGSPISFLRGRGLSNRFVVVDECQSMTEKEITTIITRMGEHSKIILCADPYQTDLTNGKVGGFDRLFKIFSDQESKDNGIFTFEFGPEDIVRSKLVKFIVEKLGIYNKPASSMFPGN